MRVVVCCKAVPVDVEADRVEVVDGEIRTNSGELFINEVDEYAIEAALTLKKRFSVETWAMTFGPLRSQEALYIALAKGIDNVQRVEGDTERPEIIASGLMAALKDLQPKLILSGVQSLDWMGGEVGVYIAHGLDMAVAYAVVEIVDLNEDTVRIKKEIGGGRKIEMVLRLPAVLCIQSGIHPLQYVSAMKRKKVRGVPIQVWGKPEQAVLSENIRGLAGYLAVRVSAPEVRTHAEMIIGEGPEKIAKILEIIRKNL